MVVRLLEATLIRVGNEEYARTNRSFGLTTLKDRHVEVRKGAIRFHFRGKGGVQHDVLLEDARMARLVRRVRDLPGQDLFQYEDDSGKPVAVDSGDVNDYLREVCGSEFTAKDFRTWAGTLIAARGLAAERHVTKGGAKRAALDAAKLVARRLGNTVAVCRKSYIHPQVLGAYEDDALYALWHRRRRAHAVRGLSTEENALLRFLEACSTEKGTAHRRAA